MPVGRPPQQETPQIVRQIPRAEPLGQIEASGEPPSDPPEPFFWAPPSEPERQPEPGHLRPIPTLVGDTFRFLVQNVRGALVAALPAVIAMAIMWPMYRWAYRPLFDDTVDGDLGLRLSLVGLVGAVFGAVGFYLFTTALANLVVQSESGDTVAPGAALRLAVRRLPRVITANLVYGLLVGVVIGLPLFLLLLPFLFERELGALFTWAFLAAGIVAYAAPQINVYFTAIKLEERRPKFRRVRRLVRGQRAAVLARVLLWQIVRVVSTSIWAIAAFRVGSLGWISVSIATGVVVDAVLTTAFTLVYADLAGTSTDRAARESGDALTEGLEDAGSRARRLAPPSARAEMCP